MKNIFKTSDDYSALIARIILGAVIFPHGAQKLLGWFGGYGYTGTMGFFTEMLHIPYIFGLLAIITEFFGSLALIAGFLSRINAFGIAVLMIVAVMSSHIANGFFMNWAGQQAGEGFEYHLLAIALSVIIMIKGGGAFSVDKAIYSKTTNAKQ